MLANVLVDLEVLYYLRIDEPPWHRYFHTYAGGLGLGILAGLVMFAGFRSIARVAPTDSRWKTYLAISQPRRQLIDSLIAGLLGGGSHIFLDSLMHREMHPFWPIADGNAMAGSVSSVGLHAGLMATGCFGLILMALLSERESSD